MKQILLLDFGSTYTKGTIVDVDAACLLAQATTRTMIETAIQETYETILAKLQTQMQNTPLAIADTYLASSAFGGFKMVVIGLSASLTAKAALNVALGSGSRILKSYAYHLSEADVTEIEKLKPDAILLTGGTDGGNTAFITKAAKHLLTLAHHIPTILAGNQAAYPDIKALSSGESPFTFAPNILPKTNQLVASHVREVLREIFFLKIIEAKGLNALKSLSSHAILPTPLAALMATELLSFGTETKPGLGPTCVIDIGGATTDVHSAIRPQDSLPNHLYEGLPEPISKRTVEGDLGMRYSSISLLENCGIAAFQHYQSGLSEAEIKRRCHALEADTEFIPQRPEDIEFDHILAKIACQRAMSRHAGRIRIEERAGNLTYYQSGKDLTHCQYLIGTGGVLIHTKAPEEILIEATQAKQAAKVLAIKQANYYVDRSYILQAMGLLAQDYPDIALEIMKESLVSC